MEREIASGVAHDKICIVGFSQGAAVALHACYRKMPYSIAGAAFLSSYLPLASSFSREDTPTDGITPALLCHGSKDPLIPVVYAQKSNEILCANGIHTEMKVFGNLGHDVSVAEMQYVKAYLQTKLGIPPPSLIEGHNS